MPLAEGRDMEKPMSLVMPLVRIKLKCPDLDSFVHRYQADVNSVGIFVRTRSPLAAGTVIRFDFRLGDDRCLFRGKGTVVWSRQDETLAPLLEAGMMLSFDELLDGTRQNFEYVLAGARTFAEAADTAPTIVRHIDAAALDAAASRPMPETMKMTADQVEELRARMREPPAPVAVDVDLGNLTRGDVTALVERPRRRAMRRGHLLGYGLAGWMLVLAYVLFVLHWMSRG